MANLGGAPTQRLGTAQATRHDGRDTCFDVADVADADRADPSDAGPLRRAVPRWRLRAVLARSAAETARAPLLVVDRFSCGKALVRVVGQPRIPASWLSVAALKFYESDGTERRGPASREVGPLRRESRKRQR